MKTHELISLTEYISKIMAYYPNTNVEYALNDILNILKKRHKKDQFTTKKEEKPKTETKEKFSELTNDNISIEHEAGESENPDNDSNEALSKLSLSELKKMASEIGIRTSSRQNKAILVMNISKTLERRRIDSTIKDKEK
ncbi:hypothetical protein ACX122_00370 [Kosakonia cowanii]